jgi:hypothetical protein
MIIQNTQYTDYSLCFSVLPSLKLTELGLPRLVDLLISQIHYLLAIFEIQAQWIHCLLAIFQIQALWIHNLLAIFLKYIISHELIHFRIDFIFYP